MKRRLDIRVDQLAAEAQLLREQIEKYGREDEDAREVTLPFRVYRRLIELAQRQHALLRETSEAFFAAEAALRGGSETHAKQRAALALLGLIPPSRDLDEATEWYYVLEGGAFIQPGFDGWTEDAEPVEADPCLVIYAIAERLKRTPEAVRKAIERDRRKLQQSGRNPEIALSLGDLPTRRELEKWRG